MKNPFYENLRAWSINFYSRFGALLATVLPRDVLLQYACKYMPKPFSLARVIQEGIRFTSRCSMLEPDAPKKNWGKAEISDQLCKDYQASTAEISFSPKGIYPTDGVVLWSLIKKYRPEIFIETGTGAGVSSQICVRALKKFVPVARMVTIGSGPPDLMATARKNLAKYSEIEIVEGLAPDGLIPLFAKLQNERLGIFIDGPKGSSPDFVRLLESIFERLRPGFIAIHDCEEHFPAGFDANGKRPQGYINPTRVQLVAFYERRLFREYEIFFMDNEWCEEHDAMNALVYESECGLKPFRFKGSRQRSHSPYLGVLLRRDIMTFS